MNSPMPHLFIPAHGLAAAWIAMAFGVDLLVYADSAWLIIAITGLFLGQSCMVMLWAVCGPQSPRMRWLVGLLALGALWIALNLGDFCMKGRSFDFLNTVLHLPGVFIAMQLPLWVVKLAWGHQIVPDPAASEEPAWVRRRLTIGDLILITTVLAGSLALARCDMVLRDVEPDFQLGQWATILVGSLVMGTWGTIAVLYCLVVAMKPGKLHTAGLCVALFAAILAVFSSLLAGGLGAGLLDAFVALLVVHEVAGAVVFGSSFFLGRCGYTLVRVRRGSIIGRPAERNPAPQDVLTA